MNNQVYHYIYKSPDGIYSITFSIVEENGIKTEEIYSIKKYNSEMNKYETVKELPANALLISKSYIESYRQKPYSDSVKTWIVEVGPSAEKDVVVQFIQKFVDQSSIKPKGSSDLNWWESNYTISLHSEDKKTKKWKYVITTPFLD